MFGKAGWESKWLVWEMELFEGLLLEGMEDIRSERWLPGVWFKKCIEQKVDGQKRRLMFGLFWKATKNNGTPAKYVQMLLETSKSSVKASFFENPTYDDHCKVVGEVARPSFRLVVPIPLPSGEDDARNKPLWLV